MPSARHVGTQITHHNLAKPRRLCEIAATGACIVAILSTSLSAQQQPEYAQHQMVSRRSEVQLAPRAFHSTSAGYQSTGTCGNGDAESQTGRRRASACRPGGPYTLGDNPVDEPPTTYSSARLISASNRSTRSGSSSAVANSRTKPRTLVRSIDCLCSTSRRSTSERSRSRHATAL
mgnify:CR=1 FL=1